MKIEELKNIIISSFEEISNKYPNLGISFVLSKNNLLKITLGMSHTEKKFDVGFINSWLDAINNLNNNFDNLVNISNFFHNSSKLEIVLDIKLNFEIEENNNKSFIVIKKSTKNFK